MFFNILTTELFVHTTVVPAIVSSVSVIDSCLVRADADADYALVLCMNTFSWWMTISRQLLPFLISGLTYEEKLPRS